MKAAESQPPGTLRARFREALWGLHFRATCGVVGLTLAMVALVCGLSVKTTRNLTGEAQREQCAQLAEVLAQAAAGAMERGEVQELDSLAHQLMGQDELLFVAFFDAAGQVVATADVDATRLRRTRAQGMTPVQGRTLGTPVFVPAREGSPAHLDVTYPINQWLAAEGGNARAVPARPPERMLLLGYVQLGLNVEHSLQEQSAAMDLVSGTAILIAMVTVPLGFIIVRRIVEPINELSHVTEAFARGQWGARSRVRRKDEIGKLAAAFNRMADLREQDHSQLVTLNAELEERVNRRTRQLHELASRDPLTGLYNRRHFGEVLARRYAEARRYDTPLSCLMLDLDDFKNANDTHGHQVGDELLVLTALTVSSQLRSADVAARFGGDEFVVLLPQTPPERAGALSRRIAEKLAAAVREQLPQVQATVSIGIGSLGENASDDPHELVRAADHALYTAKSAGKNRIITAGVG